MIENERPRFDYEFVEGYEMDMKNDSIHHGWPAQPIYQKDSLPLSTMVNYM